MLDQMGRKVGGALAGLAVVAMLSGCANTRAEKTPSSTAAPGTQVADIQVQGAPASMSPEQLMADWHPVSKEAYQSMTNKYGPPRGMTDTMAVWGETGPFKRTIVYGYAVQHDFPIPHKDVLEQFVDYHVPVEMFDELAMFDGSVIAERTKGEISARCDAEGPNLLALNLANEIVTGEISVEDARQKYGAEIKKMKSGSPTEWTQQLLFEPMNERAADDPDEPLAEMAASR